MTPSLQLVTRTRWSFTRDALGVAPPDGLHVAEGKADRSDRSCVKRSRTEALSEGPELGAR